MLDAKGFKVAQREHRKSEEVHDIPYRVANEHIPQLADDIARTRAQLLALSDAEARLNRVEDLKDQVESGTYPVDSQSLARALHATPAMHALLFGLKEEDEKSID